MRQTEPMSLAVADLGTILSVWAHPDDEAYCCGAIMAAAAKAGQRVVCVTATRGELGSTDPERWPPGTALAEVRTKELAASLETLGVAEHIWLDYPDGGCASLDPAEPVARLRGIVETVHPDTVLTFGPDGGTFHPDHMAVSRWVTAATEATGAHVYHQTNSPAWTSALFERVDPSVVMMADGEPPAHEPGECAIYLVHDGELLDVKYRAMLCQQSQVGPLLSLSGAEFFKAMLAEEAFTLPRA
jgi:LmbE family N-acetylglucosaminyl deacetylase